MDMKGLVARIDRRLEAKQLTAAEASFRATGSKDTIRNWKRAAAQGKTSGASMTTLAPVADILGTNVPWLVDGVGPEDGPALMPSAIEVPLISWISAGELTEQQAIEDFGDFRPVRSVDLPSGEWIALRVEGPSMNKISPPESIIFVNLADRQLVPNGLYVIADETGKATYKRYRPKETPPFQPASYEPIDPPNLKGAIRVIGRVRRSVIDT